MPYQRYSWDDTLYLYVGMFQIARQFQVTIERWKFSLQRTITVLQQIERRVVGRPSGFYGMSSTFLAILDGKVYAIRRFSHWF